MAAPDPDTGRNAAEAAFAELERALERQRDDARERAAAALPADDYARARKAIADAEDLQRRIECIRDQRRGWCTRYAAAHEPLPDPDAPEIDQAFIAACRMHLPASMVSVIAQVLSEVRKHYDDKLVEGSGRKWTASPHNFLAITIQNRNEQFLVSVKADPARHSFKHIHLKRSRSPYCEFYLNSSSQIEETVRIILASARY